MSKNEPPLFPTTPIFIPIYWVQANTLTLTIDYANAHYLRFPSGQGTESIPNLIITSSTTLGTTTVTAPSAGDNSTRVPSTAWVNTALPSTPSLTTTNLAGGVASQIPYQSSANTTAFIANGTSGQYLKSNGTSAPAFADISQSLSLNNLYTPFYPVSASNGVSGGIIAQTIDPTVCFGSASLGTGTSAYLNSIYLTAGSVITNTNIYFSVAGAGSMYLGLYNSAGARVAVTALTTTAQTNNIVTPYTSPYTVPTTGFYYTAFLIASGTTPTVAMCPNSGTNSIAVINYPSTATITISATNLTARVYNVSVTGTLPTSIVGNTGTPTRFIMYQGLN